MSEGSLIALISTLFIPLVALIGHYWTHKGKREDRELESRRLEVESLSSAVCSLKATLEAQQETIDRLSNRMGEYEDENDNLRQEVKGLKGRHESLETKLRLEQRYSELLSQHIMDRLPPPPPQRPIHL